MRISPVITANMRTLLVKTSNMQNSTVMTPNMPNSLVMTAHMRILPFIKDDRCMSHIGTVTYL